MFQTYVEGGAGTVVDLSIQMFQTYVEGGAGTVVDLSKPSSKGLAYLLRHKELWPKDFVFNFLDCDTCAMGLAQRTWPEVIKYASTGSVGKALGIEEPAALIIFIDRFKENRVVSPEDIAVDLESLAA